MCLGDPTLDWADLVLVLPDHHPEVAGVAGELAGGGEE